MIAIWLIKSTGETMRVTVIANRLEFEQLINSHPQMQFVRWD